MLSKQMNSLHSLPETEEPGKFSASSYPAIRAQDLSKCYQIYDAPRDRLKQFVLPRIRCFIGQKPKQYFREFWALKNISFEINKGETVGVIGRNGSGKSTLLQIICGTLTPTGGSVETNGRIAALLELGSGFNPEFTGRENVFMNGAILGMRTDEIESRFEDIIAFAEIGEFINQPVKTYSSGMYVRLAFAVNIMSQPEIMVVDEALAVGDMNFRAKCMTALTRIQERGATILFVSHDISSVKSLCSQAIYLEHGNIVTAGPAAEIAEQYVRTVREEMNEEHRKFARTSTTFSNITKNNPDRLVSSSEEKFKTSNEFTRRASQFRYGTGDVKIAFVELLNLDGEPTVSVDFNQEVRVRVFFEAFAKKLISVNVSFFDDKKNNITGCGFRHTGQSFFETEPSGKYLAEYTFRLPLQDGNYSLRAQITAPPTLDQPREFLDVVDNGVVFRVNRWDKARVWSKVYLFPKLTLLCLDNSDSKYQK